MILPISLALVVTSPFSFTILLIWVLFLFFWISLASGLSILFILSVNQLLVLLICSTVLLASNSLFSAIILMNYLLVHGLGLFFFSSSSFLRWRFEDCILDFSILLSEAWMAMYFSLRTAFAVSPWFWTDVLSFSLMFINCLNCFKQLNHSWAGWVFVSKCLSFFQIFPCDWVPVSMHCGLRICSE